MLIQLFNIAQEYCGVSNAQLQHLIDSTEEYKYQWNPRPQAVLLESAAVYRINQLERKKTQF